MGLHHSEDVDLMPELAAAALRRPAPLATRLLATAGGALALMLAAAAAISLDEVTRAEGKVIPSGQTQVVAHLYGGIVEDILVREGDEVQAHQLLLRIDNRDARADHDETRARLAALAPRAARLEAEARGDAEIAMEPARGSASHDAVALERELFRARRASLESEVKGLEEQLFQREQELRQQEALVGSLAKKHASLENELATARRAGIRNVGRLEILRLERETRDAEGELATERLKVARIRAAILEARMKAEDRRNAFAAEARRDLNETRSEIARLAEKLEKLSFDMGRNEVRAPVRGTVKQLRIATKGGVVKAGEPLVEITPGDDSLVIEGRVRPNDIAFLRTGQSALVKITAYNFAAYGGLRGTVIDISPDALESPEHPGETFYRVRIRTDRSFLERGTTKLAIAPGMTAEAAIKIGEKSLLAYILKPITRRPPTAAWQEATPPIGKGS